MKNPLLSLKRLSFNTGCYYTEHGQRLIAFDLGENTVLMFDCDRNLSYVFKSCDLMRSSVLWNYVNNKGDQPIFCRMPAFSEYTYNYGSYDLLKPFQSEIDALSLAK